MASAGCRKNAGVPVLVRVAAIFRQMIPDFPMPVTITRTRHPRRTSTARSNDPSRRSTSARIAAASVCSTLRASARSAMDGGLGSLHDRVDRGQLAEERLDQIEPQGILCIAAGAGRFVVDLQEHAVDAGSDAGRGKRLDVLREARRDAVGGPGQLKA